MSVNKAMKGKLGAALALALALDPSRALTKVSKSEDLTSVKLASELGKITFSTSKPKLTPG